MEGKSTGWFGVRDAVFARDPEPASARRHSFARINRGAHPCASGKAGASALHQTIKVSRREVRSMVVSLAIHLASREKIDAIFHRSQL